MSRPIPQLSGHTFAVLFLFALARPSALADGAKPDPAGIAFFENKIRPVLIEHCYQCHSTAANKHKGNLYVDTKAAMRKGGVTGPALVPGQPEKSLIMRALRHTEELRMPKAGKLPDRVIADFEKWIASAGRLIRAMAMPSQPRTSIGRRHGNSGRFKRRWRTPFRA